MTSPRWRTNRTVVQEQQSSLHSVRLTPTMGELRSTSPVPRLDLDNFDCREARRSRYVLTSPRSLESCARLGIKPVDLLIKSLNELIAEKHEVPMEAVRVMHESYEKERRKLLQMCRDERERIIQEAGNRWPDGKNLSCTESASDSNLKEKAAAVKAMGAMPYAELCFKGKSASPSSCSPASARDPDRSTICSFNLGEPRHSAAAGKLEKLNQDISRKMRITIPERDRKIAALMLVKHEEEQERMKLCQQEELEREEGRRKQEAQRAQAEKKRKKKLKQSMRRWQEELEARRRMRACQEEEKAGQLEQEVLLQEDRWRRLKEEVEAQRREKIAAAQREAGERKSYQEKLLRDKEEVERRAREQERQVAAEREQKARRSRALQETKERRRLQEENNRELLRHVLLKQQVERQQEEEEAQRREALERKLQHFHSKRARAAEARQRELQERAVREERQIRRAQLRAELQSDEQLTHRQLLVQLSQRRMEKAAQLASAQRRGRAQQARLHNKHRQLCHQRMRERMQREEEEVRTLRESWLNLKEWRRERLRRQREQIQEEAHRLVRASFHMRERVRQQTQSRSFHQMALEAQLSASISRMKL